MEYHREGMETGSTSTFKGLKQLCHTARCLSPQISFLCRRKCSLVPHGFSHSSRCLLEPLKDVGRFWVLLALTACHAHGISCFFFPFGHFYMQTFPDKNHVLQPSHPYTDLIKILLAEEPSATYWCQQSFEISLAHARLVTPAANWLHPSTASDTTSTAREGPNSDLSALQQLLSISTASTYKIHKWQDFICQLNPLPLP